VYLNGDWDVFLEERIQAEQDKLLRTLPAEEAFPG
jgi:hypothetical protein